MFFCLLFANAPDLDFVPGIMIGEPSHFHHRLSHSFGFEILFTFMACIILKKCSRWFHQYRLLYLMLVGYLLYLSHLLVDFVTLDNSVPYGMPLFWPANNNYIDAPIYIFSNVLHSKDAFSLHNLRVALHEILVLSPPLLYLMFVMQRFVKVSRIAKVAILSIIMGTIIGISLKANPFY